MKRRRFLEIASLSALPNFLIANTVQRTPAQTEGPFYPVEPIPQRPDLILNEQAVNGKAMRLAGLVTDTQGTPLGGIKIEIWQCDGDGLYDHPRQHLTEQFDQHFSGSGAVITDARGAFSFRTLYPVPYTGRPPHIHVKLWDKQETLLTTQLYLHGQTGSWQRSKRAALQISPKPDSQGNLSAEFTFVV